MKVFVVVVVAANVITVFCVYIYMYTYFYVSCFFLFFVLVAERYSFSAPDMFGAFRQVHHVGLLVKPEDFDETSYASWD